MDSRSFVYGLAAGLAVALAVWYQVQNSRIRYNSIIRGSLAPDWLNSDAQGQTGKTLACGKSLERDMQELSEQYISPGDQKEEGSRHQRWGPTCRTLDAANMTETELLHRFHLEAIRPNRPVVIANYSFQSSSTLPPADPADRVLLLQGSGTSRNGPTSPTSSSASETPRTESSSDVKRWVSHGVR